MARLRVGMGSPPTLIRPFRTASVHNVEQTLHRSPASCVKESTTSQIRPCQSLVALPVTCADRLSLAAYVVHRQARAVLIVVSDQIAQ